MGAGEEVSKFFAFWMGWPLQSSQMWLSLKSKVGYQKHKYIYICTYPGFELWLPFSSVSVITIMPRVHIYIYIYIWLEFKSIDSSIKLLVRWDYHKLVNQQRKYISNRGSTWKIVVGSWKLALPNPVIVLCISVIVSVERNRRHYFSGNHLKM